jgi:hypothetical protein
MSKWDPDPDEIRDVRPYDYEGAKRAIARASRDHTQVSGARAEAASALGQAERAYRKALALKITELHADGVAWTVCLDLAKGDTKIADLRYQRDVAKGILGANEQLAYRCLADRRELEQLIDWSMKVAPNGEQREPANLTTYGGARAI